MSNDIQKNAPYPRPEERGFTALRIKVVVLQLILRLSFERNRNL